MNNKIPNLTPLTALIVSLGLTASKTTPTLVSQVMYLLIILSLISKQVCEELESKYHQPNIIIQSDGQNSHNYKPKNKRKTKGSKNNLDSYLGVATQCRTKYVDHKGKDTYWMAMVNENKIINANG